MWNRSILITIQWSTVANLPEPMYLASATLCGGKVYMLGWVPTKPIDTANQYMHVGWVISYSLVFQGHCWQTSRQHNGHTKPECGLKLLIYQLMDPPVRPFKIDYWQLVATWTHGNLPLQFTCTIRLPTHGKSSVTWQLVNTGALQRFSLATNWWWWEVRLHDRLRSKIDTVEVASV